MSTEVNNKIVRDYIEEEAIKTQKSLILMAEPNLYEYTSVKALLKSNGVDFQFNVKNLTSLMSGSYGGIEKKFLGFPYSYEELVQDTILPFNVIETEEGKTIQFKINEPNNLEDNDDKLIYVKFLRSVFWEYWDLLKKDTNYDGIVFNWMWDYNLFSRAMVLPYTQFSKLSWEENPNFPSQYNIFKMAELFNVHHTMIIARLRDLKWIV